MHSFTGEATNENESLSLSLSLTASAAAAVPATSAIIKALPPTRGSGLAEIEGLSEPSLLLQTELLMRLTGALATSQKKVPHAIELMQQVMVEKELGMGFKTILTALG